MHQHEAQRTTHRVPSSQWRDAECTTPTMASAPCPTHRHEVQRPPTHPNRCDAQHSGQRPTVYPLIPVGTVPTIPPHPDGRDAPPHMRPSPPKQLQRPPHPPPHQTARRPTAAPVSPHPPTSATCSARNECPTPNAPARGKTAPHRPGVMPTLHPLIPTAMDTPWAQCPQRAYPSR